MVRIAPFLVAAGTLIPFGSALPRPGLYAQKRFGRVAATERRLPVNEPTSLTRALSVRGGDGCTFDTSIIAKVTLAHHVLFGLASNLAPESMMSLFHPEDSKSKSDKELQYLIGKCGAASLAAAVLLYCIVIEDMSVTKAGGYSIIPWVLSFANGILPESRAVNQHPIWLMLGLCVSGSVIAYGCHTGADWAGLWIKIWAGGAACDFLTLTFFAKETLKSVWQPDRKTEQSKSALQYWRWFGILIGMYSVHLWALLQGQDAVIALGSSQLLFVALQVLDLLTQVSDKAPKIPGNLILVALSTAAIFGCEKGVPSPPIED